MRERKEKKMESVDELERRIAATLNKEQLEAVQSPASAVLVLAGPGSGKTRVITSRVAWLLKTGQCQPYGVVLVTFTNKAAAEMRSRVSELVGAREVASLHLGTFHSIANKFLRRHAAKVGIASNFTIADQSDAERALKGLIQKHADPTRFSKLTPRVVLGWISKAKNLGQTTADLKHAAAKANGKDAFRYRFVRERGLGELCELPLDHLKLTRALTVAEDLGRRGLQSTGTELCLQGLLDLRRQGGRSRISGAVVDGRQRDLAKLR